MSWLQSLYKIATYKVNTLEGFSLALPKAHEVAIGTELDLHFIHVAIKM